MTAVSFSVRRRLMKPSNCSIGRNGNAALVVLRSYSPPAAKISTRNRLPSNRHQGDGDTFTWPSSASGAVATKKRCCCSIQAASFSSISEWIFPTTGA